MIFTVTIVGCTRDNKEEPDCEELNSNEEHISMTFEVKYMPDCEDYYIMGRTEDGEPDYSRTYYADNLPDIYKVDSLRMNVTFLRTEKSIKCGFITAPVVNITEIHHNINNIVEESGTFEIRYMNDCDDYYIIGITEKGKLDYSHFYYANNLPDMYKVNSLRVDATLHCMEESIKCGLITSPVVNIIEIQHMCCSCIADTTVYTEPFYVFVNERRPYNYQCGYSLFKDRGRPDYMHAGFVWAEYLPEEYQEYLLRVIVTYRITKKGDHFCEKKGYYIQTDCGYPIINIIEIKKQHEEEEPDNEEAISVTFENLASAPKKIVSKENLPEWLVVRINNYYETRPSVISKVLIYQGEWNDQIVYFILDTFSSCLCDFFTKDGERADNLSDLCGTSKNWIIIYEYGDFVLNLDELYKDFCR